MTDNPAESVLDVTGLLCPLPVLKAGKRLSGMAPGSLLTVIASDPMTAIDMPHFCAEQGHTLLAQTVTDTRYSYVIRRA